MNIDISLTPQSPYHSAPINGGAYRVDNEGRIHRANESKDDMVITRTYSEPKFIASRNELVHFPVIRSLQLLKQLRSSVVGDVVSSLKNRGLSISSATTYAGMMVGAASGKPTNMAATLDQTVQALQEPIALFGGGSYGLSSTVTVTDANVLHTDLVEESLVSIPAHLDQSNIIDIDSYKMTFPVPITRNDPIANANTAKELDNLTVIENYHSEIEKWRGDVATAQAERKEDKEKKKYDLNNMVAVEAVVPGIVFTASISVPSSSGLAVKGALIATIGKLQGDNLRIGGRVSRGFGAIRLDASIDDIAFDIDRYENELAAYDEWLEQVTSEDLAIFYEK